MSSRHNRTRLQILEVLYKFAEDESLMRMLDRESLKQVVGVSDKDLDFNVNYLAEKGLIYIVRELDPSAYVVKITSFGMDVLENKGEYSRQYPFLKVTIQEIHGDVHGNVVQAVGSKVNINQLVTNASQAARLRTEQKKDIPITLKEEIIKTLDLLETELKKEKPDLSRLQIWWNWLKRYAKWVVPTLSQIILEVIKNAMEIW